MRFNVKILRIEKVTHDVKRFTIEKPRGYEFAPGQATEVSINRDGFKDKKRPFTFTSLNADKNLEFIIKAYPLREYPNHTGVTEKIHTLKVGDEMIIGESWGVIEYKGPGVFIAGGAGITPFVAIFKELYEKGKIVGNTLIFSNKKKRDVILEEEFRKMLGSDDLILTLTREKLQGYGYGRIDERFLKKNVSDFSQPFYVCGPWEMVTDIKNLLRKLGASSNSIVFEK